MGYAKSITPKQEKQGIQLALQSCHNFGVLEQACFSLLLIHLGTTTKGQRLFFGILTETRYFFKKCFKYYS